MNDQRRRSSVTSMLETLGWDTLQERRKVARITTMKKITCGRVAINPEDYLLPNSTRTRSVNSAKFKHYSTKTEVFKNSYFPRTIPQWNNTSDQAINKLLNISDGTTMSDVRID